MNSFKVIYKDLMKKNIEVDRLIDWQQDFLDFAKKVETSNKINIEELKNEYVSDQLGKFLYETNCSKELLIVAEEKAEYRRTINKTIQTK